MASPDSATPSAFLGSDARTSEVAWVSPPALSEDDDAEVTPRRRDVRTVRQRPLRTADACGCGRRGTWTPSPRWSRSSCSRRSTFVPIMPVTAWTTCERWSRSSTRWRHHRSRGPVDTVSAVRGREVYQEVCAACHGSYTEGTRDVRLVEHPNRLVAQDRMHTDPRAVAGGERGDAWRPLGYGVGGLRSRPRSFGGYVAPRPDRGFGPRRRICTTVPCPRCGTF